MKRRTLTDGRTVAVHDNDGLRKICGCPRRQWAKCAHPWHFSFKWNGTHYRFSLDREFGRHIADKTKARTEADKLRTAIREGTFRKAAQAPNPSPDALTVREFGRLFLERCLITHGKRAGEKRGGREACYMGQIIAFVPQGSTGTFGDKPIGAVTEDDLEAFLTQLRAKGRAASTRNQYLQLFKSLSKWGRKKGYLSRSWFSEDSDLKRDKLARRSRRLQGDDEARLLQAAGPRLQRLIIAALETGCRQGELLSLQWRDVNLERRELRIRAEKAKDNEDRVLPISTRLAAVLEMGRLDPAGQEFGPDAYVFGDEVGRRLLSPRKAWQTCVLRAYGIEPTWDAQHKLTPDCRARLRAINLRFHDLRHEAGSRFLEGGWPLHQVKEMLGHADISTTDTYLNATRVGLQESMRQFEETRNRCKTVASGGFVEPPLSRNAVDGSPAKSLVN